MQSNGSAGARAGWTLVLTIGLLPAQGLSDLFVATVALGAEAPAARQLRRQGAPAAGFLCSVLEGEVDPGRRRAAVEQLMRMGRLAEPAVPLLLDELDRVAGRDAAITALGEVAPFVAEALRQRIAEQLQRRFAGVDNGPVTVLAGRAHVRALTAATDDLARIDALLGSGDGFRIELACQLLVPLAFRGRPLLPRLAALAEQAAFPIGPRLADGSRRALPCTAEWRREVRAALYAAVTSIDPDHPAGMSLCRDRLGRCAEADLVPLVRRLAAMGRSAAPAAPDLLLLTQHRSPLVVREAVTALGMVQADPAVVGARLAALAAAPDPQAAARARAALRQIERPRR